MSLHESVRQFCSEIGTDPMLVQGAGGNVSWKENDILWIKASGTWLADADDQSIFVPVNLGELKNALKNKNYTVVPQTSENSPLKPSIETLLHALMPHRIVAHLHAIEVLVHLVKEDFDLANYPNLDKKLNARTVDYYKPGPELAEAVANQLNGSSNTRVIFLKNHGVIIGGESVDEVSEIIHYLSDFFLSPVTTSAHQKHKIITTTLNNVKFHSAPKDNLHELMLRAPLTKHLKTSWALYPDHIVFLGAEPHIYRNLEDAQTKLNYCEHVPDIIFIENIGVLITENTSKAKIAQLECYYEVIIRQTRHCKLKTLTHSQISELINWDAEKYRMRLSK